MCRHQHPSPIQQLREIRHLAVSELDRLVHLLCLALCPPLQLQWVSFTWIHSENKGHCKLFQPDSLPRLQQQQQRWGRRPLKPVESSIPNQCLALVRRPKRPMISSWFLLTWPWTPPKIAKLKPTEEPVWVAQPADTPSAARDPAIYPCNSGLPANPFQCRLRRPPTNKFKQVWCDLEVGPEIQFVPCQALVQHPGDQLLDHYPRRDLSWRITIGWSKVQRVSGNTPASVPWPVPATHGVARLQLSPSLTFAKCRLPTCNLLWERHPPLQRLLLVIEDAPVPAARVVHLHQGGRSHPTAPRLVALAKLCQQCNHQDEAESTSHPRWAISLPCLPFKGHPTKVPQRPCPKV